MIEVAQGSESKFIVRGYSSEEYHGECAVIATRLRLASFLFDFPAIKAGLIIPADIEERVAPALEKAGLTHGVRGGGRIAHKSAEKTILVYGYSQVRGRMIQDAVHHHHI